MGQVFLVVNPSTRGFLLSGVVPGSWYEAVTCIFRMKKAQWWRSYGNELWEFDEHGLMRRREASINDVPITPEERRIFGTRPTQEHGKTFPMA